MADANIDLLVELGVASITVASPLCLIDSKRRDGSLHVCLEVPSAFEKGMTISLRVEVRLELG